jgi:hypothetical protein
MEGGMEGGLLQQALQGGMPPILAQRLHFTYPILAPA